MPHRNKPILVSGARGNQGGAIARELLASGWTVRAMTRYPESDGARALAALGAEVVQADLNDEASLRRVLSGAWGTVAVQNTWEAGVAVEEEQGHRFARVAKDVGVQHFVYQSVASAHRKTGIPHFDNKSRIEDTVRSLEFPSHVIVRPVFFMENLLGPFFKPYIDHNTFAIGLKPDTPLQMIAVADIGKYGLAAFERANELNGREIDIASDEHTPPQVAAILSAAAGREIKFYRVPIEDVRKASQEYAIMLEWFDAVGYNADIEANAAEFGIKPTRFQEWAAKQNWEVPAAV
jgi:uncharacterized protein YbjT (DUF2867 family)